MTRLNLTESECLELADVYFKSSIEMAIASLRSGLEHARKINNLKLVDLLEKDIDTYVDIFNKRELEKLNLEEKQTTILESEKLCLKK